MHLDDIVKALNPEILARFKTAIETGRWPDGRALTENQRETCIQAIIAYEHRFVDEEERTGYVPPKSTPCAPDEEDSLVWRDSPSNQPKR